MLVLKNILHVPQIAVGAFLEKITGLCSIEDMIDMGDYFSWIGFIVVPKSITSYTIFSMQG